MENFGYITLNISLVIYFIHFLPQTIHNQFKHKTFEISLWTHSLMIVANSLDLIYAIGFKMQWQYILVDLLLLSFLSIQQLQILNDRRNKKLLLHTLAVIVFLVMVAMFGLFIKLEQSVLLIFGSISAVIYNVYWLPQIYKNFRQKQAQGFSIFYLGLSLFLCLCDLNSSIFLGWPIVSTIQSMCLGVLLSIFDSSVFLLSSAKKNSSCSTGQLH